MACPSPEMTTRGGLRHIRLDIGYRSHRGIQDSHQNLASQGHETSDPQPVLAEIATLAYQFFEDLGDYRAAHGHSCHLGLLTVILCLSSLPLSFPGQDAERIGRRASLGQPNQRATAFR